MSAEEETPERTLHTHTQRISHVRAQQEGGHLQAEERGLAEISPGGTLDLDFSPPERSGHPFVFWKLERGILFMQLQQKTPTMYM